MFSMSISRYPSGSMALRDKLPANCLLFRQHSEGLYFARSGNFEFIKIMQAIYMQSLSTDVLILFNSFEPIKLVHKLILNSVRVQLAFKESCYMLPNCFDGAINLAEDKTPICYLFQFLVQGFIRVLVLRWNPCPEDSQIYLYLWYLVILHAWMKPRPRPDFSPSTVILTKYQKSTLSLISDRGVSNSWRNLLAHHLF